MSDLDELKRLLFGKEQRSLVELEQRVEDPETRAHDVASVLSESVRLSMSRDGDLSAALKAPVNECIRPSIREDVDVFADVLFPVMGPAIRGSVMETFRALIQSLNQTIESVFSWQGLKWRIESRRTGVPIAELVLRGTLEYRVEQVLVIQRESGLLVRHAARTELVTQDSDAVSAMLTAIQDFVHDSFAAADEHDEGLDVVEIGEHTVWLFPGPAATLAVVFRGTPRLDLRQRFAEVNEALEREYGAVLSDFAGDSEAFSGLDPVLSECLEIEAHSRDSKADDGGRPLDLVKERDTGSGLRNRGGRGLGGISIASARRVRHRHRGRARDRSDARCARGRSCRFLSSGRSPRAFGIRACARFRIRGRRPRVAPRAVPFR